MGIYPANSAPAQDTRLPRAGATPHPRAAWLREQSHVLSWGQCTWNNIIDSVVQVVKGRRKLTSLYKSLMPAGLPIEVHLVIIFIGVSS